MAVSRRFEVTSSDYRIMKQTLDYFIKLYHPRAFQMMQCLENDQNTSDTLKPMALNFDASSNERNDKKIRSNQKHPFLILGFPMMTSTIVFYQALFHLHTIPFSILWQRTQSRSKLCYFYVIGCLTF